MEGPTPVSALIHAATMVTAGVYLIARMYVLFELAPTAADISRVHRAGDADLRRDLRAGGNRPEADHRLLHDQPDRLHDRRGSIGAYARWMFQLMTHAFFKALLFMAAGSVISAMAGTRTSTGWAACGRRCRSLEADDHRRLGARRVPVHVGVLLEGRDPRLRDPPRRLLCDLRDRRLFRGAAHGLLRLPDHLPGLLGRARARGAGARAGTPRPRPAREPADRRGGGHRRRLSRRGAPHRRARTGRCGWPCRSLGFLSIFGGVVEIPGPRRRGRELPGGVVPPLQL